MWFKGAIIVMGLATSTAFVSIVNCGDVRQARKGEACQTTDDCAGGLACVPATVGGGVCVLGAFSVAQTAKECAIIECTTPQDCCGPPPASCPGDLQLCQLDAGAASQQACARYNTQCVCDTTQRDCEQNKCVAKCTENNTCIGSGTGRICAGGRCVQCGQDTDCVGGALKCKSGKCQAPCEGDGDCPGFERCLAGECAQGGCSTNRECVAATRNVEATCGTDGKCIVPCATDLECGNPKNFKFFSCVSGQCLYLGCASDKDCRLFLEGTISTSSSSGGSSGTSASSGGTTTTKQHIVCRDKQTPGNTTIPAQ